MEVIGLKAIIVDIEEQYLIVATKDGLFKKIKNTYPDCELGEEINIPDRPHIFNILTNLHGFKVPAAVPLKKVAAVFVIIFFMISGYAVADYMKPVTFVSVDINPSFELALNRYLRVLAVKGLDESGEKIVSNLSVKNMPVEKAIKILLNQLNNSENIGSTEINTVMLAISNIDDKIPEGLEEKLEQTVREEAQKLNTQEPIQAAMMSLNASQDVSGQILIDNNGKKAIKVIVEDTTIDKHKEAAKKQLSQGKLLLYEKIKDVKPSTTLDEIKSTSLSALIGELEKISKAKKDEHSSENKAEKREKDGKENKKAAQKQSEKEKQNGSVQRSVETKSSGLNIGTLKNQRKSNQGFSRKNLEKEDKEKAKGKDIDKDSDRNNEKDKRKDKEEQKEKDKDKNKDDKGNKNTNRDKDMDRSSNKTINKVEERSKNEDKEGRRKPGG